jgi:ring-1,2-phenylacetyl-CoA epoxidase subunit PaaD
MKNEQLWNILEDVKDPEIPVLSLIDLGVVRNIEMKGDLPHITITPTYSGCPAMMEMEADIKTRLMAEGFKTVEVKTVLTPTWTTDWITEKGRVALQEYGIAPPEQATTDKSALLGHPRQVTCPQCKSTETEMLSQFGSTPCKALYRCKECKEPFDYFKCI